MEEWGWEEKEGNKFQPCLYIVYSSGNLPHFSGIDAYHVKGLREEMGCAE